MSWTLEGTPLRSALVTRLRYLGDIVMSTVVLRVLRCGDPDLDLGFLCERPGAPLLAGHPDLSRLHVLDSRRRGSDAAARRDADGVPGSGGGFWTRAGELRRHSYDLGVDLLFNPRSAWLMRLSGCRYRIGGDRGWRRRLFTHPVNAPAPGTDPDFCHAAPGGLGEHLGRLFPLRHATSGLSFRDWYLDTFPEGLAPRLATAAPTPAASRALSALGVAPGEGYTLLLPGATWPSKAWPAVHWGRLATELPAAGHAPVVMLPPPDGGAAYREALSGAGCLPPLPLADALSVVAGCDLVVTVDGGLMHAAVALGRPTVALLGPTDPEPWFPYAGFGPYRALCTRPDCHPCDLHHCDAFVCLPDLSPERVLETVADLRPGEGSGP